MRIICPNCAAQYEVEASEVPPTGRDLICSACGNAWFHTPEPGAPSPADDPAGPQPQPAVAYTPEDTPDDPGGQDPEPPETEQDSPPPPPLDPSLRAVLRAEAEREAQARQTEASAPRPTPSTVAAAQGPAAASDTEAPAPTGPAPEESALEPSPASAPAKSTGTTTAPTAAAAPPSQPAPPDGRPRGRALLPAVEDVSPSGPKAARSGQESQKAATPRPRRRAGLVLVILLGAALAAAGLYVHTRSADAPPGAMIAYADWVERRQADLTAGLDLALERINALLRGGD